MLAYRRFVAVAAAVVAPAVFAAAPKPDIENGNNLFALQCNVCHSVETDGGPVVGPNLRGVVGRKAASTDFPMYTPALKASKVTWNAKNLDEFLTNPGAKVPGTMMAVAVTDAKTRADIIAYLATLKK